MSAADPILTVAQMQAAEQAAIDAGTSVDELMQRAGRGAAEWVWRMAAGRSVTVLCGAGNNGGDGYVLARVLHERGHGVTVVAPKPPGTPAAAAARQAYKGPLITSGGGVHGAVLVDCLFGSGLSRALAPDFALLLRDLLARHSVRIAVDLPSGVESDSGRFLGVDAVSYDLTLVLGAWKYAHWRMPAAARMGERRLVPIGVDPAGPCAVLIERPHLSAPPCDAHKYTRGLCAVVGGEMAGAALLSCEAAMRSGAGYVKLLAPRSHPAAPAGLVVDEGDIDEAVADRRQAALLIGPGLGREDEARHRLSRVLKRELPTVLDADALVVLRPSDLTRQHPVLATPHDGELAALCQAFGVIGGDRMERAQALARVSGMTILAKGPDTLVAAPDSRLALSRPATSWLSVAGSGDVLAGIAVSRMACGRDPFEAACEAVWLHGEAARRLGPAFTAEDLAKHVDAAMAACL